ncbi:hypothetical protein OAS39_03910 [Pirellulales bacterium]|nr:hypothetical protein [Pirellulales bacterium]
MRLRVFLACVALTLLPFLAVTPGCQRVLPGAAPGSTSLFTPPPSVGTGQAPNLAVAAEADGYLPFAPAAAPPPGSHPLHVNVQNREWAWEQIVDIVDDYFRIERERQVQLVGDVLTEGRIDTYPQLGGTVVEPHLLDSVGRYNRWESTFQTIRRRATVRVIPDATGYLIDVEVHKEMEDLPQPELSTAGAAAFRNDSSLPSRLDRESSRTALSDFWIPLGRDIALEEDMKARLRACMGGQ